MTVADDVRNIATAAEPAIEAWLDAAEEITELRIAATEKGLEWSSLKAVIVARIKDRKDGGNRVQKLTEKADNALTYADALRNKIIFPDGEPSPPSAKNPPVQAEAPRDGSPTQTVATPHRVPLRGDSAAVIGSQPVTAAPNPDLDIRNQPNLYRVGVRA